MINRDKLKHILEYARQQQKFASPSCRIPPGDMVEIMERLLLAESVCTCPSGDGSLRWPCPVHAGNSPVIPDGYVMVPKEPTKEMINAGWLYYMGTKNPSSKGTYKAMLAAAQQEGK